MTDRKAIPNPFDSDVVTDPEKPSQTDVAEIHKDAFERCQAGYERVAAQKGSWSILLFGEAGCGKTHLLSRFRQWLTGEMEAKPISPKALFVPVRMEAGPTYIWRHVRRRFAEELLRRGSDGSTNLDLILGRFAAGYGGNLAGAFEDRPVRDMGHDLMTILEHYAAVDQRRLCRAWLTGDGISESDRLLLNLPQAVAESTDEDLAEYESRRLVLAITRLCAPYPVVFCFDQVEALGISQQNDSYRAFSRMGASLIDEIETGNSLVISTILASFLRTLEDGSMRSDYQRISKDRFDLQPLDWHLGKRLVEARLRLVPEIGQENPVPEPELRQFYQVNNQQVTPRRLIHEAKRLFAFWQGKQPEPFSVAEFIRTEFERLWSEAEVRTKPKAADDVLSQGLPVALQLMGRSTQERPAKNVDLATGSGDARVYIAYANQGDMRSLTAGLRRLQQLPMAGRTLCVVRDERIPVTKTAKGAQERLREIAEKGGRVIRVETEALAALDAMRRLLAQAISGDLSLNGDTIGPQTVREWLASNLPSPVAQLARNILGEEPRAQESAPDALLELLEQRKVVPLEEAARLTELPQKLIEDYARTHPNRVVLFRGACPVVCQSVAETRKGEASGAW